MPPKNCFIDEPHYYSTCLHELAHWTGAKHRLNRLTDNQPFGSPEYAREEIRADLSSLFMRPNSALRRPKDQAAYIKSWIKVLKDHKNEVFRAAADASKACDYLHSLGKGKAEDEPGRGARNDPRRTPRGGALGRAVAIPMTRQLGLGFDEMHEEQQPRTCPPSWRRGFRPTGR